LVRERLQLFSTIINETIGTNGRENDPAILGISNVNEQDPWESRRAWKYVIEALRCGRYSDVVLQKSKIENTQREMRSVEAKSRHV